MNNHRCGGADCPTCEHVGEERASRVFDNRLDEESATRRAEQAYERQLFGRYS